MTQHTDKATRAQLLAALRDCQTLFGNIRSAYENDRAPDRATTIQKATNVGEQVCIEVLGTESPQTIDRAVRKHGIGV